jgi:glycyl-tRNA synthetase beta chain
VTRDLLFEIGVEELPGGYAPPALEQLESLAREGLAGLRLSCDDLTTYGTPRRLALYVRNLAARQTDLDEEATGPSVKAAFDAEGKPTRALLGFCQGKGVDPRTVRRVQTPKGEYVAVTVHHQGRPAIEVLPALLGVLPGRLTFPKSMRWIPGDDARFARPVRWLVALLGRDVVPARAFGLDAGRTTYGHRFLAREAIELRDAGDYLKSLERAKVVADHRLRRETIVAQFQSLDFGKPGEVVDDPELLDQVNFLVEWPHAFVGSFDPKFHVLPNEVIITALREHQRFFAVAARNGGSAALLQKFVAVRNGDGRGLEVVRRGNQDVLTARLEDARFYWETDLAHPPASRMDALGAVVWIEGLGTLRDKAARLEALADWLSSRLAAAAADDAKRAALLCKTDLLSEMIGSGKEYTGLQGIIGGYYAEHSGEPVGVARAITEHYRPAFASDALPSSVAGAILSLADKLDHVAGAFVAGKAPSGSEDPYGVRRAGNGVVRILIGGSRPLDLRAATMQATAPFFAADPGLPQAALVKQLGEFWRGRVEAALEQEGIAYDTRDAALDAQLEPAEGARGSRRPGWIDPADALARARVLGDFRGDDRFAPLVILYKRVANILKAATEPLPDSLDRARLTEPAERELLAALESAREHTGPLWTRAAYDAILPALLEMEHAIHGFFDHVMVNVEDPATRGNRLRLLAEVRDLFIRGWDLSRVVVEGERG